MVMVLMAMVAYTIVPLKGSKMRKGQLFAGTILAAVALAGCEPSATVSSGTQFNAFGLTTDYHSDGTTYDTLNVSGTYDHVVVTAPQSNLLGNTRIGFTHYGAPNSVNEEICLTWVSKSEDGAQPGVLLRWNGTDGLGFTQNIIYGVYDQINLHLWSANDPHYTMLQSWNLSGLTGKSFPWEICARAENETVRFKVWPTSESDPGYGNPAYSGSATVTLTHAGETGAYAGHIHAGNNITYQFNGELPF